MGFKKAPLWPLIAVIAVTIGLASCLGTKTKSGASTQTKSQARGKAAEPVIEGPTVAELRDMRINLMGLNIPCGMGVSEAASKNEALGASTDSARVELAKAIDVQSHRFTDTYARNVSADARKKWEERVGMMSSGTVKNSPAYKSATEYNRETKTFTVHTLVIIDPEKFKQALVDAAVGNDEFNKKARKDMIMNNMDAIIADFNSQYRK